MSVEHLLQFRLGGCLLVRLVQVQLRIWVIRMALLGDCIGWVLVRLYYLERLVVVYFEVMVEEEVEAVVAVILVVFAHEYRRQNHHQEVVEVVEAVIPFPYYQNRPSCSLPEMLAVDQSLEERMTLEVVQTCLLNQLAHDVLNY